MVILAAVPVHDIGGGSRGTQIAIEMVRQGYHVTVVPLFEAQESVDLGLRFVHPNLEQTRVDRFDPQAHAGRAHSTGLVLVEAPAGPLLAHGRALKKAGWELVYDVIDDWSDPALGGEWYRPELEQELVTSADRVVASAPDLIRRVEAMGRAATLVPNAVNVSVFGVELPPRPADLPEAETIIGYHGSLYGEWLDWESVGRVAEANPQAIVAIIGDDKAARPTMPSNVRFLGLKSQTDLPAYVQRFDVGLVPFKMNDTTHAVSPLKAYEYLASGVPIAAPPLRALEGLDGAHLDPDLVSAVGASLASERPDRAQALKEHSWEDRVVKITGTEAVVVEYSPVSIIVRPAVHWSNSERLVGRSDGSES